MIHVCCNSQHEQHVNLFNRISFKLIDGEKVLKIDERLEQKFKSFFNNSTVQIPLFRCVQNDNYIIYIGIPYNTSLRELANRSLEQTSSKAFFEGDTINEIYKSYIKEEDFLTSYIRNFDNNLVYVLAVAHSEQLSDTLFNREEFSNRFVK